MEPPGQFSCGTDGAGWFNDTLPVPSDGIRAKKVCFHWNTPCQFSNNVLTVACDGFYLFNLIAPFASCLRYCTWVGW